jgi:hypothetical protein
MKLSLLTAFFLVAGLLPATTISLNSSATETTNNSGLATINIAHDNPAWSAAFGPSKWISYVESGDPSQPGFVQVPPAHSVIFTDSFTLPSAIDSGVLDVKAAYTARVSLNGVLLKGLAPITTGLCAPVAIGCTDATEGHITLSGFRAGLNVLTITVVDGSFGPAMADGPNPDWDFPTPFGLDYSGTITEGVGTPTPEPVYLVLMGLPMFGFAIWRKRHLIA